MGHRFAEIAFTQQVRQLQTQHGSRDAYARFEESADSHHQLTAHEKAFIQARDSFYMASISESGWPYIQHRGGVTGFLKVLDDHTLGFTDFSGNKQYISTGNFQSNDRVALFMMDYPHKTRLKLLGRIRHIDRNDPAIEQLIDMGQPVRVERGFYIDVEAFDWNCPKYITPRFSEVQIQQITAPLQDEIAQLKAHIIRLQNQ